MLIFEFVCSSISSNLIHKVMSFIWVPSILLNVHIYYYKYSTAHLAPLTTVFVACISIFVYLKIFFISLLIFYLIHWLVRNVNFHILVNFLGFSLLLITVLYYCSWKRYLIWSVFLHQVRVLLWPNNIWFMLENVLFALENKVYCIAIE